MIKISPSPQSPIRAGTAHIRAGTARIRAGTARIRAGTARIRAGTGACPYDVTICAQDRECVFGEIVDGEMHLNNLGQFVQDEWLRTSIIRPDVELDAFVVMPNHVHGIICVVDGSGGTARRAPTDAGRTVRSVWAELLRHYAGADVDGFVVLPNSYSRHNCFVGP